MIEISDPLPQSKIGVLTLHDILFDEKCIGRVEVEYIQQDEMKMFRKYTKRKLFVGQPYGTRIFIDTTKVTAHQLGKNGLLEIVNELKKTFKGIEDRDIYILELTEMGKKIICKASEI